MIDEKDNIIQNYKDIIISLITEIKRIINKDDISVNENDYLTSDKKRLSIILKLNLVIKKKDLKIFELDNKIKKL